ncbi:MAG TPA: hypothetical protein VF145_02735 [Chitinophagaceae bacterium]
MKRVTHLVAAFAMSTLLFTACKKDSSTTNPLDESETELTFQSDDQARISGETDEVADEINAVIETSPALQGKSTGTQALCNATVTFDTLSNPRTATITYNGLNCIGNRSRTGVVVVSIPAGVKWKDAGAVITVTITNLKITRVSDGKFITINGTKQITNVTGGRMMDLPSMGTIIHTIASNNMTVKFDTSTQQRSWNIARKRTFTYANNSVVISTTGNHTIGTNTKVAEWGTNRFGHPFVTSIQEPLLVRQSCQFRLTGGVVKHELVNRNLTVTFGLDAQGNAMTTCPGSSPFYMKLVWIGPNNITYTVIRPY